MRRTTHALRLLALVSIVAWIAVVTVRRADAVARGRTALDAVGEARWMAWAYRDPPLAGQLAEAQRRLAPGEAVLLVSPPDGDTNWLLAMAEYGLPRQAVVDAKLESALGRAFPTRVLKTGEGVRVLPRSAGPLDGPR